MVLEKDKRKLAWSGRNKYSITRILVEPVPVNFEDSLLVFDFV